MKLNKDATRTAATPNGWRQKAWEARKLKGVPLDLPSGATIKVVRPRFESWFGTAKLPAALASNVVKVFGTLDLDSMEKAMQELEVDEQNAIAKFMNDSVMAAVVEPRVVDKPENEIDPETEMALTEIGDEDRAWIMLWVFEEGLPNMPVATEGGEVPMASLKSADNLEPGPHTGKNLREVRETPE